MKNEIVISGDVARLDLGSGRYAAVDIVDLPLLSEHRWAAQKAHNSWYATAKAPKGAAVTRITLHRAIMGAAGADIIDHIDGDGLNNRRSNLRFATHAENMRNRRNGVNNTSGFKGVHWHKRKSAWMAQIKYEGRRIYLGLHLTREAAHDAYVAAAVRLHGEFARTA